MTAVSGNTPADYSATIGTTASAVLAFDLTRSMVAIYNCSSTAIIYLNWAGNAATVPSTNLLTYSQDFTQAGSWSVFSLNIGAAVLAPDGTITAESLTVDNSSAFHRLEQANTTAGVNTFSVYLKPNGYNYAVLSTGTSGSGHVYFDLVGGVVTSTISSGISSAAIASAPNGFFRCSITLVSGNQASVRFGPQPASVANGNTSPNFTGDGASGVHAWGAQYETLPGPSAYIPTTTAPVSNSQAGDMIMHPYRYYLFDWAIARNPLSIVSSAPNTPVTIYEMH